VDPKCPASCCKQFDVSAAKSITQQVKVFISMDAIQLTSGTSHAACCEIKCTPKGLYTKANQINASWAVTGWGTVYDTPGYDSTLFDRFRITSIGGRFFSTRASNESNGVCGVFTTSQEHAGPTLTQTMWEEEYRESLYEADFDFLIKPNGPSCSDYNAYESVAPGTWPTTYVWAMGDTNTSRFGYIELVVNLELIPFPNVITTQFATEAAPSVPEIHAAVSRVKSKIPLAIKNGGNGDMRKQIKEHAKSAAREIVRTYGPGLLNQILGSTGIPV
jgi:hypothetical protein